MSCSICLALAFQQFPYQKPLTNGWLARYHLLYGHRLIAPLIEREFGLTSTELFQLLLLLIEDLQHRPAPALAFRQDAEPAARQAIDTLIGRLSTPAADLRVEHWWLLGAFQAHWPVPNPTILYFFQNLIANYIRFLVFPLPAQQVATWRPAGQTERCFAA